MAPLSRPMAKLINGEPVYSPKTGIFGGKAITNPSEQTLLNDGYKYEADGKEQPESRLGGWWKPVWSENDTEFFVVDWEWVLVPISFIDRTDALTILAAKNTDLVVVPIKDIINATTAIIWNLISEEIPDGGQYKTSARAIQGNTVRGNGNRTYLILESHITSNEWAPDITPSHYKLV